MTSPPDPRDVRTLIVRANNWIGDVVLASPALHALRLRFSGARILVIARPHAVAALDGSGDLDELVVYDHTGRHAGLGGRIRLVRELRRRGPFDLAVLFQKAFEAALLARAAGARRVVGYATDRRRWLLTDPVEETEQVRRQHHARAFLGLAAAAGARADSPEDLRLRFPLAGADRLFAHALLVQAGIGDEEPLVAVHPGSSKLPRAWHPERLGRLARAAAGRVGARVVVVGSAGDAALARRVLEAAGGDGVDLTGRTSVKQMAAVFERSCLFLGSDSGPMHVAAAVGTRVLALFGPGLPEKTAPFLQPERFRVVTRRFPCSPCRQDFFRECEPSPAGKPYCLEEITIADAEAALEDLLGAGARAH